MNECIFTGRLTKDVEVRYTTTEKIVASFSIAVGRDFKNPSTGEYETDFFNVIIWGKSGELAGNTLKKGSKVLVRGRMQNRSYEAKDGTKRYVTELIADKFEYLDKKEEQPKSMKEMGKEVPFDEEVPF